MSPPTLLNYDSHHITPHCTSPVWFSKPPDLEENPRLGLQSSVRSGPFLPRELIYRSLLLRSSRWLSLCYTKWQAHFCLGRFIHPSDHHPSLRLELRHPPHRGFPSLAVSIRQLSSLYGRLLYFPHSTCGYLKFSCFFVSSLFSILPRDSQSHASRNLDSFSPFLQSAPWQFQAPSSYPGSICGLRAYSNLSFIWDFYVLLLACVWWYWWWFLTCHEHPNGRDHVMPWSLLVLYPIIWPLKEWMSEWINVASYTIQIFSRLRMPQFEDNSVVIHIQQQHQKP